MLFVKFDNRTEDALVIMTGGQAKIRFVKYHLTNQRFCAILLLQLHHRICNLPPISASHRISLEKRLILLYDGISKAILHKEQCVRCAVRFFVRLNKSDAAILAVWQGAFEQNGGKDASR